MNGIRGFRIERRVLVDGVHPQDAGRAIRGRVDLADQSVAVQDRQREVAPAPLRLRLVHLERELELEDGLGAGAVVDQAIERREQGRASGERPVGCAVELCGIHPPGAGHPVDDRGLAGVAHLAGFGGEVGGAVAHQAERLEAALVPPPPGLLDGERLDRRIDALREIPEPAVLVATAHRDVALHHQDLEHLRDVLLVGPARGRPREHARVVDLPGRERTVLAKPLQHVLPEGLVRVEPLACLRVRAIPAAARGAAARDPRSGRIIMSSSNSWRPISTASASSPGR